MVVTTLYFIEKLVIFLRSEKSSFHWWAFENSFFIENTINLKLGHSSEIIQSA